MRDVRLAAWKRLVAAAPEAWVLEHCRSVEALACAMADCAVAAGHMVNREAIQAGAMLHDIGRCITHDVRHATLGADLLRNDAAWDSAVIDIVERHTGAGITAEEASALQLPVKDYTPRTLEEKIVAHADNLYSANRRLTLAQLQAKYEAKKLPRAWKRIEALHHELCQTLQVDLERLAPAPAFEV